MLTLLRVPRLLKSGKNGNGQELEKTLEEGKEIETKQKEEKVAGACQSDCLVLGFFFLRFVRIVFFVSITDFYIYFFSPFFLNVEATPITENATAERESPPEEPKVGDIVIQGLTEEMVTVLIRSCVSMLGVPVDPDTLHATLRLCLRLTRDHKYAMMFAELKSTRMILSLTQSSGFNGFTPLVTLLFRHIIEDPCTLQHTMEKVCLFIHNIYYACVTVLVNLYPSTLMINNGCRGADPTLNIQTASIKPFM